MTGKQAIEIIQKDVERLMRLDASMTVAARRLRRNTAKQVAQAVADITGKGGLLLPGPRLNAILQELEREIASIIGSSRDGDLFLKTATRVLTTRAKEMDRLVKKLELPKEALLGTDVSRNARLLNAVERVSDAFARSKNVSQASVANILVKYRSQINNGTPVPYKRFVEQLQSNANIPSRYAGTVANTSLVTMDRELRQDQARRADIRQAKYVGPRDSVTRPFCATHLGQVRSWEYWENTRNDVGPNPPAQYGGGWNCRHALVPWLSSWDTPQTGKPSAQPQQPDAPAPTTPVGTQIGQALTLDKAKDQTLDILVGAGLNVDQMEIEGLTLDQLNARNVQLQALFKEYTLKNNKYHSMNYIDFKMSDAGKKLHGFVQMGPNINTVFQGGITTDKTRHISRSTVNNLWQIPKSLVDADKEALATMTHEFAHLVTISQLNINQRFWRETNELFKEYKEELKQLVKARKMREAVDIYLGDYAGTEVDEFMAEAFTEYKLSSSPTKYARALGELFDKYFKKP